MTDADETTIFEELYAVIEDRKRTMPEESYTASLLADEKGENAVLEKLGEELTEVLLAAKDDDAEELTHESADLVYHLFVLLAAKEIPLSALEAKLRERR